MRVCTIKTMHVNALMDALVDEIAGIHVDAAHGVLTYTHKIHTWTQIFSP